MPELTNVDDELGLWLTLFNAKTEEDLAKIYALGVPFMEEAIEGYYHVSAEDRLKEIERLRFDAHHNEVSALANARRKAEAKERKKWEGVVAKLQTEKDAALAEKDALIAELQARLDEKS